MTLVSSLPRSTPDAQGIPSAAINDFVSAVEQNLDALHSFMLLRHGQVVAEGWWDPYRADIQHMLFSLSKSFTSTAIGLLVAEGRLSVDDPVLYFFPDDAPPSPSPNLQAMKVRHLLSMSTGQAVEPTNATTEQTGQTWVQAFLAHPVVYEPGTHFLYNSSASYMLSAIVQKITGQRMLDYLQPRLFEPLGIANPHWETSPQGIDAGGWGLNITTADIAAFGQLYLQKGEWQGKRILPEAWVDAATSLQIQNGPSPNSDWEQGYGYQFWRCRHNAYRGDGAFGQFCVIMPDQDAVLAITAGLSNMQRVLDLVWEHLLPAMGDSPLPANNEAQTALATRLANLRLPTPQGQAGSSAAERISGKWFVLDENPQQIEAIRFDWSNGETVITIRTGAGEQQIACGYDRWVRGTAPRTLFDPAPGPGRHRRGSQQVAACGAWTDETTYTAKLWWYETPYAQRLTCRFSGDRLTLEQQANVSFGPTTPSSLKGRLDQDTTNH